MKKRLLFIFGTRPEAIKLAPLVRRFAQGDEFEVRVCVTAQHREMLDQILSFFAIKPDYDLNLMKPSQSLFDLTADGLRGLGPVLRDCNPDAVFVQGDTTTAFIGALAGYYHRTKVVHVEAGLRSFNKYSPFPEEINRTLAGHIADIHLAPTRRAADNLAAENIREHVHVVGNTVIDALFFTLKIIEEQGLDADMRSFFSGVIPGFPEFAGTAGQKLIMVTGHRRESFGKPFENICNALRTIAETVPGVHIVYPVHLNPGVREPVNRILKDIPRIYLIEPLDYPRLIWLMNRSHLVLTDSGGIQEEAPSLGKPVLVMRDVTERTEGIDAGTARLVGTETGRIVSETKRLLNDPDEYQRMSRAVNPYGDGSASNHIYDIMKKLLQ